MNKFEEYELYMKNKDFLVSDSVITFTDTNGRLMALKPDVTLSIIKNIAREKKPISKLYYNESVYRVTRGYNGFREIPQTGIECIGNVDNALEGEVIALACESLRACSEDYILELAHTGLLLDLISEAGVDEKTSAKLVELLGQKNLHEAKALLEANGADKVSSEKLLEMVSLYGPSEEVLEKAAGLASTDYQKSVIDELKGMIASLSCDEMKKRIQLDFSAVFDTSYYNGVVFRGYINGLPGRVLSGGRYDALLKTMNLSEGAVGFAVYVDELERLDLSAVKEAL